MKKHAKLRRAAAIQDRVQNISITYDTLHHISRPLPSSLPGTPTDRMLSTLAQFTES